MSLRNINKSCVQNLCKIIFVCELDLLKVKIVPVDLNGFS